MQQVSLKLSVDEVQALLELVANQLFRMKYIDSKIPGHKGNAERLQLANTAVDRLKEGLQKAKGLRVRGEAPFSTT
jgi:hypothetical protein